MYRFAVYSEEYMYDAYTWHTHVIRRAVSIVRATPVSTDAGASDDGMEWKGETDRE